MLVKALNQERPRITYHTMPEGTITLVSTEVDKGLRRQPLPGYGRILRRYRRG